MANYRPELSRRPARYRKRKSGSTRHSWTGRRRKVSRTRGPIWNGRNVIAAGRINVRRERNGYDIRAGDEFELNSPKNKRESNIFRRVGRERCRKLRSSKDRNETAMVSGASVTRRCFLIRRLYVRVDEYVFRTRIERSSPSFRSLFTFRRTRWTRLERRQPYFSRGTATAFQIPRYIRIDR